MPLTSVVQDPPRGTGDAVRCALPALTDVDWIGVLFADHPLLTADTVARLIDGARAAGAYVTLLTCVVAEAGAYGRIERDDFGRPTRIIERKEDDPARRIGPTEINSGMMVLDAAWARSALPRLVPSSAALEYYLTDLVELAVVEGAGVGDRWPVATVAADPEVALGINDRAQLAAADAALRDRIRRRLMATGVSFVGPETIFVDEDVAVGEDTVILPHSILRRGTTVGARCTIGPAAVLDEARLGDDVVVRASFITRSSVANGSDVGPYSHLRGGAEVGPGVHVGNFAELKQATLGAGVKVGHVSYLGDARIGAGTNIGAGTITANYDGVDKHQTEIGSDVFIGSDTVLIAPVRVDDGARTGAGSVVTRDVPGGATVVGVPARIVRRRDEG
jgi:bifunctional UDP-N-acetylglucosamine pyrophosphorylase/glucosamine-1-phosphate N-acetyltransferase